MLDIMSWKAALGRWVNHTGPMEKPAIPISGTSIMSEPLPAWAPSITRHSGCAWRQAWNTSSEQLAVAHAAATMSREGRMDRIMVRPSVRDGRSEERRVGKEGRGRVAGVHGGT